MPLSLNSTGGEYTFRSSISVRFERITTSGLVLTFRNDNPSHISFEYRGTESLLSQALREPPEGFSPSMTNLAVELDSLLASARVKELIGLRLPTNETFTGYEYLIGFDNIWVGSVEFKSTGIYVSKPLEGIPVGQLGLKSKELRPFANEDGSTTLTDQTYDQEEDRILLGSIEYWVVKQDLKTDGSIIRTSTLPILPLGVTRVEQERLLFTERSNTLYSTNDIAYTMFFTNVTDGDIEVFLNGELQTGVTITSDASPNQGVPMRAKIQMNPGAGDIVTVSYNVLTSTTPTIPTELEDFEAITGLQVVDLTGDLRARLYYDNVILCPPDDEIIKTRVYLIILLRRNTHEYSLTPSVEEYTLVTGTPGKEIF